MSHDAQRISSVAQLSPVSLNAGIEIQNVIQLNRLGELLSRPFLQSFAEDHSITLTEWRVLLILAAGSECASQDVADISGIHPMNISRAVKKLQQSHFLTTVADTADHRRKLLRLTDAGWAIYDQLFPVAEQAASKLFSVLTADELAVFTDCLQRLGAQAQKLLTPSNEISEK